MKKTINSLALRLFNTKALTTKKTMVLLLATATTVLAGCVSPRVTKPPPAAADLQRFHQAKLVVTDAVNTAYSKEGVPVFEGLLKGRLQALAAR